MKFKKFSEVKYEILAGITLPMIGGVVMALRTNEWHRLWRFLVDNQQWAVGIMVWLLMLGLICLMAEALTPERRRLKRILGCTFITLWIWAAIISSLFAVPQPPTPQRHINPPNYWWRGGKN